jgi:hypothetical protein
MITTSLEAALLILTIEFGLLAGVVTFSAYRGAHSVEAESAAQATELVSKVSNTEDTRRTALETVFKDKYQFEGDELGAAVDEFMQREKAFYNAVVGAFLGRGNSKISDLKDELTKIVAPWISITPKNMVDKGTGLPPQSWSTVIVRKRRIRDGEQTTQTGRDRHEVTAG